MIELQTGWLSQLRNADHVGLTAQIFNDAEARGIANASYRTAVEALRKAVAAEDEAYKKTQKDWAVEELKTVSRQLDCYMKGLRSVLAGYAAMPPDEERHPLSLPLLQLWKDFRFHLHDGYSSKSAKVVNMCQEVELRRTAAEQLGVWSCFERARQLAVRMQSLLGDRFSDLAARVVGELKHARAATDAAVKHLYQVIDSLQVLEPSEAVDELALRQRAIEDYARVYYLKTGVSSADRTPDAAPPGDGNVPPEGGGD